MLAVALFIPLLSAIVTLFALYTDVLFSVVSILFTVTVNVSVNLLYPLGGFVSSIVIISVPVCVISIFSIFIIPVASVLFICIEPSGNVILNSASCSLIALLLLSTFNNSILYSPSGPGIIIFSKSSSSSCPL